MLHSPEIAPNLYNFSPISYFDPVTDLAAPHYNNDATNASLCSTLASSQRRSAMRSFNMTRFAICTGFCLILGAGALATVSAQATATPAPTVNPMIATMAEEPGVCP